MTNENISSEMHTLLEIIGATRSIHKMNILNQSKQLFEFSEKNFNKEDTELLLSRLAKESLIIYIQDIDSYKITDKGKELII